MSDFERGPRGVEQSLHVAEQSTEKPRWWADPQMLVAVAALFTSVVAVGLGAYGAYLQRQHDRAEVWPHVEVGLWEVPQGVAVQVANTGIGPARIESVDVTVNGKPVPTWDSVLVVTLGKQIPRHNQETIVDRALRAGDKANLLGIGASDLPADWRDRLAAVGITICYTSVFNDGWSIAMPKLGGQNRWTEHVHCTKKPSSEF